MTTAIYPGSFDPFTKGHLNIVEQASELFEGVIIVVSDNATKSQFLNKEERATAIEKDVKSLNNVQVKVLNRGTLLTDFMEEHRLSTVIRGVRSGAEFDAEAAYIGNLESLLDNHGAVTSVFVKSYSEFNHISSSAFKSVFVCNGWVGNLSRYLPRHTANLVIKMNDDRFLEDLWLSTCKFLIEDSDKSLYDFRAGLRDLLHGYNRSGYHTIRHLLDCLQKYCDFANGRVFILEDYLNIMALFWHDFVYIPGNVDNEEKSADACHDFLVKIGANDGDIKNICTEILNTKEGAKCEGGSYVRDVDLSILAADPDTYKRYKEGVELEFRLFNKDMFNASRTKWLQKMLASEYIFSTYYFKTRHEHKARINLETELKERTNGS